MRMWGLDYTFTVHYEEIRIHLREKANNCVQTHSLTAKNDYLNAISGKTGVQLIITTCTLNIKNTEIICTSALMIVLFILMPSRNAIELQTV